MRLNETFGRKLFVCAGVLFAIGTAGLSKASAATVSWALPASGNFNTGSNWDTGLVPGALDVALFDTGSAGVMVDFSLPTTITQLGVRQDGVTFDLQGLTLSLAGASPSNSLAVGSPASASSSATFQSSLPGGAVSTNNILIEAPALGTADMVVTGTNLTLTQAGSSTVTVGDNLGGGNASLSINDQATFNTGTGLFTVNTTGSVSLASNAVLIANGDILIDGGSIGGLRSNSNFNWAPGNTFTVQNGGSATNFSSQYDSPAGSSWVVTGVGSTLFGVGNAFDLAGTSSIAVNDGGVWTKGFSVKGSSTVTADGTGAGATLGGFDIVDGGVTLTNGATSSSFFYDIGDFVSGGLGTGTLNIQSGSTVTSNLSNGLQISSSNSDTNGVVNVTGPGSALNLISTIIGSTSSSTGELNLSSGGTYNSTGTTRVNPTGTFIIGGGGVFNASGPTLVAGGLLDVQASGVFNVDADLTSAAGRSARIVWQL